jgi:multiple sugar transport system substrate-binding protein
VRFRHLILAATLACTPEPAVQTDQLVRVMAEAWMFKKYPMREAAARFEANHPGVRVELIKSPDGSPTRLLVSMMSNRSDFDLFFGTVENTVAMWGARDLLIPWNDIAEGRPKLQRDAFIPVFYDLNRFGTKQFGIPISAELNLFSVNKHFAREAGLLDSDDNVIPARTWDDVFDYARRMTRRDDEGNIKTVGLSLNWTNCSTVLYAAIKAEQGRIVNPNSALPDIHADEVRRLLTLTAQGAAEGITTLAAMSDVNEPRSDLKAGLVAMILTSHSRYIEAQETLGPNSTTIMSVPGRSGGVTGDTRSAVIPRNSQAIDLAIAFTQEELLAPYFSRFAWEKYGKLPCALDVFDTLKEPEAHILAKLSEQSDPDPKFRDDLPMVDAVRRNVQSFLSGQMELDPMLARLEQELSDLNLSDIREHFSSH